MFSVNNILGNNFGVLVAGMNGLAQRQEAHMRNLANINTKGYTAQTVNFEQQLEAMKQAKSPMAANGAMMPGSVADGATGGIAVQPKFAVTSTGKTVKREEEIGAMMNDNIRFRLLSQQVTNRISALRSVIAEIGRS